MKKHSKIKVVPSDERLRRVIEVLRFDDPEELDPRPGKLERQYPHLCWTNPVQIVKEG